MDHGYELGCQPKLCFFNPEAVSLDDAWNGDGISAENGVLVGFWGGFEGLPNLPVAAQVVDMVASDRHNSSSSEEDVMGMYYQLGCGVGHLHDTPVGDFNWAVKLIHCGGEDD